MSDHMKLLKRISDARDSEWEEVVKTLAKTNDGRVVDEIIRLVNSREDRKVRERAMGLLCMIPGEKVENELIAQLDGRASQSSRAIGALRRRGSITAIPKLEKIARENSYDLGAINILGWTPHQKAVESLIRLLETDVSWPTLQEMKEEERRSRTDGMTHRLKEIADALWRQDDPQIGPMLVKKLNAMQPNTAYRIMKVIGRIGYDEGAKAVSYFLGHDLPQVREQAMKTLSMLNGKEAIRIRVEKLFDVNKEARDEALKTMVAPCKDAVELIVQSLMVKKGTLSPMFLEAPLEALWKLQDPAATDILLEMLIEREGRVSSGDGLVPKILDTLVSSANGPEATAKLIGKLSDSGTNPNVRALIAEILGEKHCFEAKDAVIKAFEELGQGSVMIRAIGDLKITEKYGQIYELTHSPVFDIRDAAIYALGEFGFPDAVDRVIEVKNNSFAPSIKETALRALAKIGTERALEELLREACNPKSPNREEAFRLIREYPNAGLVNLLHDAWHRKEIDLETCEEMILKIKALLSNDDGAVDKATRRPEFDRSTWSSKLFGNHADMRGAIRAW